MRASPALMNREPGGTALNPFPRRSVNWCACCPLTRYASPGYASRDWACHLKLHAARAINDRQMDCLATQCIVSQRSRGLVAQVRPEPPGREEDDVGEANREVLPVVVPVMAAAPSSHDCRAMRVRPGPRQPERDAPSSGAICRCGRGRGARPVHVAAGAMPPTCWCGGGRHDAPDLLV